MRSRVQAFTLPEVLVASLLASFLMTGVYGALTVTQRALMTTEVAANTQQSALIGMKEICGDMLRSRASLVVASSSPAGVLFADPQDGQGRVALDAAGKVLFQRWIAFYVAPDAGGRSTLYLKQQPINPPSTAPAAPSLAAVAADATLLARTVARDISSVSATVGTANASLRVTAQAAYGSNTTMLQLQQNVVFRNP